MGRIFNHFGPKATEFSETMQNSSHYAIHGLILVPFEISKRYLHHFWVTDDYW